MLNLLRLKSQIQPSNIGEIPESWMPWEPTPGPQTAAFNSLADVLGYGGSAGGGKSALLKMVAVRDHQKAIIFRREYSRLKDLIDKSRKLLSASGAIYNSNEKKWRNIPPHSRSLEFGACRLESNTENWRGIEHDFKGIDEVTELSEEMFLFLTGWCRSPEPTQRCRIIFTFNPPHNKKGRWIIDYLAPWIDPKYKKEPAKPGELRYFIRDENNKDIEIQPEGFIVKYNEHFDFDGPEPVIIDNKRFWPRPKPIKFNNQEYEPRSRTFIAASLSDNPYLRDSGYRSLLQSLPEPLRSQLLYGDYSIQHEEDPWQVIPSAWIDAAMARWSPSSPLEQSHIGVDVARGGKDNTIIVERYGNWIAPLSVFKGETTPDGNIVAQQILSRIRSPSVEICVDSIGVGAAVIDCLKLRSIKATPLNGAESAIDRYKNPLRDRSGLLTFLNRRAYWWWHLRELLDPSNPDAIALPPDDFLAEELAAPRWEESGKCIKIESKDNLMKADRLGRSPDRADAVVYCFASISKIPDWLIKT